MCRRVTCSKCSKPTWAGCGAHIESVLGNVKPDDRCKCRENSNAGPAISGGLLGALFGRR